jgi:hypothetical protein
VPAVAAAHGQIQLASWFCPFSVLLVLLLLLPPPQSRRAPVSGSRSGSLTRAADMSCTSPSSSCASMRATRSLVSATLAAFSFAMRATAPTPANVTRSIAVA